jgi:hypothetical protein
MFQTHTTVRNRWFFHSRLGRKPSLEALEAIINAFRENGLEITLEDLVKVK